jgi:hypothetical protein
VKSREARRREAWRLIWWGLGAIAVLLILDVLIEGISGSWSGGLGPWIGASIGASLTYLLTRQQRHKEDDQRRRALATALLSEIRFLEGLLRDIDRALAPGAPGEEMIEPYRTAVYASAGANLLLLSPETVHALNALYQLVYRLGAELQEIRHGQIDASVDDYCAVRLRAVYAAHRIPEVAARLQDYEGGIWPDPLPYWSMPYPELPPFPPPVFEDNDPRRRATQRPQEQR